MMDQASAGRSREEIELEVEKYSEECKELARAQVEASKNGDTKKADELERRRVMRLNMIRKLKLLVATKGAEQQPNDDDVNDDGSGNDGIADQHFGAGNEEKYDGKEDEEEEEDNDDDDDDDDDDDIDASHNEADDKFGSENSINQRFGRASSQSYQPERISTTFSDMKEIDLDEPDLLPDSSTKRLPNRANTSVLLIDKLENGDETMSNQNSVIQSDTEKESPENNTFPEEEKNRAESTNLIQNLNGKSELKPTKSLLNSPRGQKVFSMTEKEQRPYFEMEFEVPERIWNSLIEAIGYLRSENLEDMILGANMITKMLLRRSEKQEDPPHALAIIQRAIVDLEELDMHYDPEVKRAVSECLDRIRALYSDNMIRSLALDEMMRREQIHDSWDGRMNYDEHTHMLQAKQNFLRKEAAHRRRTFLAMMLVLGIATLGCLSICVVSLWFVVYPSPQGDNCLAFLYATIAVLSWCVTAVPLMALLFNFVSYSIAADPDLKKLEGSKSSQQVEAIEKRQSLRVTTVVFLSFLLLGRYAIALSESFRGFCGNIVSDQAYINVVVFLLMTFMLVSLFMTWLPEERISPDSTCCSRVWVPSMSRFVRYGGNPFKSYKPLFKNFTSLQHHFDTMPEKVSLEASIMEAERRLSLEQAASSRGRAPNSQSPELLDPIDYAQYRAENAEYSSLIARMYGQNLSVAVQEYFELQRIVHSHQNI